MPQYKSCRRPATKLLKPHELYAVGNQVRAVLSEHLHAGDGLHSTLNSIIVNDVMLTQAHTQPAQPVRVNVKAARRALARLRAKLDEVSRLLA